MIEKALQIIKHRVNTLEALSQVPDWQGVEIDVRYHNHALVLSHDPFHGEEALPLERFLASYGQRQTLIVNLKTEGIEEPCLALLHKYAIHSWFFLDMSVPFWIQYAHRLEGYQSTPKAHLSVRYSPFEPIAFCMAYAHKVQYVWVDCFEDPSILSPEHAATLRNAGFLICLVSPELHGKPQAIDTYKQLLYNDIDLVCTKQPEVWSASSRVS